MGLQIAIALSTAFLFLSNVAEAACTPQCVDYVNEQLVANGFKKMSGSANQYVDTKKNPGISVAKAPTVNSIIVFSGTRTDSSGKKITFSSVGHVGWVTASPSISFRQ